MEKRHDWKDRGSDADFWRFSYFVLFVQSISYSTAAAKDYLSGRDCGELIWLLPFFRFSFLTKSGVSVSFQSRLGRGITV